MGYVKQVESGRSMVEMLGVLSVIGVLSVGGIAGFRYAMDKREANDIKQSTVRTYIMSHSYMMRHTALSSGGMQPVLDQVWGKTKYNRSLQAQDDKYSFQLSGVPQGSCRVLYGDSGFDGKAIELVSGTCDSKENNTLKFLFDYSAINTLFSPDDDSSSYDYDESSSDDNYYYCSQGTQVYENDSYLVCQCYSGYFHIENGALCPPSHGHLDDGHYYCSRSNHGDWYQVVEKHNGNTYGYCMCDNGRICDFMSDGPYCCDDDESSSDDYASSMDDFYYCDHGTRIYDFDDFVCQCDSRYYGVTYSGYVCMYYDDGNYYACSKDNNGYWIEKTRSGYHDAYCVCYNDSSRTGCTDTYCCDDDDYYYCSLGTEVGRWGDRNYPVCRCDNTYYGVYGCGALCGLGYGKWCSRYNEGYWFEWAGPYGDGYCMCDNSNRSGCKDLYCCDNDESSSDDYSDYSSDDYSSDDDYYYCDHGTEVNSGPNCGGYCACDSGYYSNDGYAYCYHFDSNRSCSQYGRGLLWIAPGQGEHCHCFDGGTCNGQYCCDDDDSDYYCDHGTINYAATLRENRLVCNCEDGYYGANDNDFALCDSYRSDMSCSKNLRNGHWQVAGYESYCVCDNGRMCNPYYEGSYCCDE